MSEVKSRRKPGPKGAAAEPEKRSDSRKNPEARGGAGWADPRTGLSLLSLAACLGLAWLVFQQSEKFSKMESQYQLLQMESSEFQGLQKKISLISDKDFSGQPWLSTLCRPSWLQTQIPLPPECWVLELKKLVHLQSSSQ